MPEHASIIAACLRVNCLDELRALVRDDVTRYIRESIESSAVAWSWMVDDTIGCMWGLKLPMLIGDTAYGWALMTPKVAEHRFTFVRHSRAVVRAMLEIAPTIQGHVDCNFRESIKWLTLSGFEVDRSKPIQTHHVSYFPFFARKK